MGLGDAIARLAVRHAHVLVVEVPHHWRTRAVVERLVLARGWALAVSPAEADVLVVCGEPRGLFTETVEMVWHQMSGPRVRLDVQTGEDVVALLDQAAAVLLDSEHHREDARNRPTSSDFLAAERGRHDEHSGRGEMDHGEMDHGEMDHGEMDDGGMDMAPDGIPLAVGGEDRDGLEMDVLHVSLGPVLPHWPAGLVLRCSLQGDVIVEADARMLDQRVEHQDSESAPQPARRCDNIAALLALAGRDDVAAEARAVRDELLTHPLVTGGSAAADALAKIHRTVIRSRVLRWSLRGIRPVSVEEVELHGLPTQARGDTYDRLLRMLELAESELADDHTQQPDPARLTPAHLPLLVTGLDLATARLVIASLDIHTLSAEHSHADVAHA